MVHHPTRQSRRRSAGVAAVPVAALLVAVLAGCAQDSPTTPGGPTSTSPGSSGSSAPSGSSSAPSDLDLSDDVATAGTTTLDEPTSGATLDGPSVHVSGSATAFEGTLVWDVRPADDPQADPAAQGSTQAGANGEVGPFAFDVELEPGAWTVQVWEPDMSDGEGAEGEGSGEGSSGEGGARNLVRATFTVG